MEKEIETLTRDRDEMDKRFTRYEAEEKKLRDEVQRLKSEL